MFISPQEIIKNLNLADGKVVADFGCGQGHYTFLVSKVVGEDGKVYAIDIEKEMLDKINREADKLNLTNIETLLSDVEHKVLLNNQVCDLVIMSNVLSEVVNLDKVLLEAKRVLKPQGRILITDWKAEENELTKKRPNLISEEWLVAFLAKHNLQIKKHLAAGDYHYALVVA